MDCSKYRKYEKTTNNKEAASYAAEKIAEAINFEGEIAIVAHDNNSETGSDRIKGFSEKIIVSYPNIRIVEVVLGLGEHDLTSDLVTKLLQTYPKLKGIFATNEGSAIGTLNSIVQNKREKNIVIVGFDAGLQQKTAISQGIMLGAYRDWETDRKSTRLNSSHITRSRMPSSA